MADAHVQRPLEVLPAPLETPPLEDAAATAPAVQQAQQQERQQEQQQQQEKEDDAHSMHSDEGDVCRICRMSSEDGNALFHPCKCSGSIRFVHQQCLLDWLKHSGNTHCEVCKHKFSFTPVYAEDAPATLPWHELLLGLVKLAFKGIRVAHRVFVVCCLWLVMVPWITCMAWRLFFLHSVDEVPRMLQERCNLVAVATDCIQGSLLSIGIVFLNMAFTSARDYLRACIRSLELQFVLRDAAAPGADGLMAPLLIAAGEPELQQHQQHQQQQQEQQQQEHQEQQEPEHRPLLEQQHVGVGVDDAAGPAAAAAASDATEELAAALPAPAAAAAPSPTAAEAPTAAAAAAQTAGGPEAPAAPGPAVEPAAAVPAAAEPAAAEPAAAEPAAAAPPAAGVQIGPDVHMGPNVHMGAHGGAALLDLAPEENHDAWGDIPFEELIGLQGPWVNFLETIVLVMIGNAFFLAIVIYVPLNLGRVLLVLALQAARALSIEQQQQLLGGQGPLLFVARFVADVLGLGGGGAAASAAVTAAVDALPGAATALLSNGTAVVSFANATVAASLANATGVATFANVTAAALASAAAAANGSSMAAFGGSAGGVNATGAATGLWAVLAAAASGVGGLGELVAAGASAMFAVSTAVMAGVADASNATLAAVASAVGNGTSAAVSTFNITNGTEVAVGLLEAGSAIAAVSEVRGAATAGAGAAAAAAAGAAAGAAYPLEPLPVMALTFEQLVRELQLQVELPTKSDLVALSLGHAVLLVLTMLVLYAYVSMRLWRAHSRRARRRAGRPQLLRAVASAGRWTLTTAALAARAAKLMLLLTLELGAFPLCCGAWLDLCALPLTGATFESRTPLFAAAPALTGFLHWVLGVGFMLGFTVLVCVAREVLRPGALPFLKDPTNAERNPIREMLHEPLGSHLARVALSGLVYACLCVVLVHLPALLAKALLPGLFPLQMQLFDPLTQIPADMLLFHVLIPFTVEHVRIRSALRIGTKQWLKLVGRALGLSAYLLPPHELLPTAAPGAGAAAAIAAAPAGDAAAADDAAAAAEADAAAPAVGAAAAPAGDAGAAGNAVAADSTAAADGGAMGDAATHSSSGTDPAAAGSSSADAGSSSGRAGDHAAVAAAPNVQLGPQEREHLQRLLQQAGSSLSNGAAADLPSPEASASGRSFDAVAATWHGGQQQQQQAGQNPEPDPPGAMLRPMLQQLLDRYQEKSLQQQQAGLGPLQQLDAETIDGLRPVFEQLAQIDEEAWQRLQQPCLQQEQQEQQQQEQLAQYQQQHRQRHEQLHAEQPPQDAPVQPPQQQQDQQQQPGEPPATADTPRSNAAAAQAQPQHTPQHPPPVHWFEQQRNFPLQLFGLAGLWVVSMVALNTLLLTLPVLLGRLMFKQLALPFQNDLYTGAAGFFTLWAACSFAATICSMATSRSARAMLTAAWRWTLLVAKVTTLGFLWLGVVATMLGVLCELILLPLRLPPNQTALIYLYQDWTMGVLALKLWHLGVMVLPRREGVDNADTWRAHFEVLQRDGLRHLDFGRALRKIVLPVIANLGTCLAGPYVLTRGLLPLLPLPARALQYANLYGHAACHGLYLLWLALKRLRREVARLHNRIRDDKYLLGRQLINFPPAAAANGDASGAVAAAAGVDTGAGVAAGTAASGSAAGGDSAGPAQASSGNTASGSGAVGSAALADHAGLAAAASGAPALVGSHIVAAASSTAGAD